jgi:hypothetical protein
VRRRVALCVGRAPAGGVFERDPSAPARRALAHHKNVLCVLVFPLCASAQRLRQRACRRRFVRFSVVRVRRSV